LSCLEKILSNARDWHGGRKKVKNISTSSSERLLRFSDWVKMTEVSNSSNYN